MAQTQEKIVTVAGAAKWYAAKDGQPFTRARANFVDGTEVHHGITVPRQVWVTLFGFGDAAQPLADAVSGRQYRVSGVWEFRTDLTCLCHAVEEVPEVPTRPALVAQSA